MAAGITRLRPVLVDGLGGGAMSEQKLREALEKMVAAFGGRVTATTIQLRGKAMKMACEAIAQQPAASTYGTTGQAEFKAFHASLCRRFGYIHDENYWWRDLVSLQEHIAKQVKPAAVVELTDDEIEASVRSDRRPGTFFDRIDFARAVIAAHIAKQGGAA